MSLVSNKQDGWYSHYVLLVFLLAYILSFIDRNVMSVLVGPIKQGLELTDFQFGLLHGLAFSLFYTFLGLPIARLADRANRRWVVTIGVGFWSLMTCACGMAKGFWGLFLARMGVGLGEAALSPPAYSMLADYFTERRLPVALAIFSLGITIGGGLAYMIGAWVYELALGWQQQTVLPEWIQPWQFTFIAVGLPGFLVMMLMLTVKEPKRTGVVAVSGAVSDAASEHEVVNEADKPVPFSLTQVLEYLNQHRRLYTSLIAGISVLAVLGYGYMSWYVEFLIRQFGVTRQQVGFDFGMLFLGFGSLGALFGGSLASWMRRFGYQDANMRLVMIIALLWAPGAILGPLSGSFELAFWTAAPSLFFLNSYFGVAVAALQLVTPNQLRAQVAALLLFLTNLLGLGFGPVVVGFFTDHIFADEMALGSALSLLAAVCCPLSAALIYWGLPVYRRRLRALQV